MSLRKAERVGGNDLRESKDGFETVADFKSRSAASRSPGHRLRPGNGLFAWSLKEGAKLGPRREGKKRATGFGPKNEGTSIDAFDRALMGRERLIITSRNEG